MNFAINNRECFLEEWKVSESSFLQLMIHSRGTCMSANWCFSGEEIKVFVSIVSFLSPKATQTLKAICFLTVSENLWCFWPLQTDWFLVRVEVTMKDPKLRRLKESRVAWVTWSACVNIVRIEPLGKLFQTHYSSNTFCSFCSFLYFVFQLL